MHDYNFGGFSVLSPYGRCEHKHKWIQIILKCDNENIYMLPLSLLLVE